jgi:predicted GIY-YIG superfamily endonuclease
VTRVCLLQSLSHSGKHYIGVTFDLDFQMKAHNAGDSPHTSRHRPWRLLLAYLIAAASCWSGEARAAEAEARPSYDVMVLVYAPDEGPARVAMSYPAVVDHEAIRRGLGELARRSGATIGDVRISDGKLGRGMAEMGTAAEFAARGLVREAQPALPVGPIIRSMPEWRRMRLVFVVGEGFQWAGPRTTAADGFALDLVSSMKPYEYDVEIRSSGPVPPEAAAKPAPGPAGVLPALLIGLPAGVAMGWLALGERQGSRARTSRR